MKNKVLLVFLFANFPFLMAQNKVATVREHISIDKGWYFAFGHPSDTKKDFNNGTAYFTYLAKAGYGEGVTTPSFDDRSWRKLDLPHDWAVELPIDAKGSHSHGYKAIGHNFPDVSVGWYRKTITIPQADLGRRITIAFDGVYRNSMVWVNSHYLGTEPSGYLGFEYDISAYINYGGENTIVVRADASMEEGWFYEGAGIYRHAWLNKTDNLHVATNGTLVTVETVKQTKAALTVTTTINNDGLNDQNFTVVQTVLDAAGKTVAIESTDKQLLKPMNSSDIQLAITIDNPILWDLDNPYLYTLKTAIVQEGKTIDTYTTTFGIRTIRFDNNEGFFLNGKHVKIKGTNNHQDHAGVGAAMPDGLQEYRIKQLKAFGSNAYRCSHNPPTPELLDACDRLGMLVIDENRLMGITQTHLGDLKRLIDRDRNHPSIISWSIGNEEWGIENNISGARIATTMQAYVKSVDSTRPATVAFSGGIGSNGITTVMDLLGINYVVNKSTDEQHKLFPNQCIWGTEEGSTNATRGAYFRDDAKHVIPAYDKAPSSSFLSIEDGWKHYATRPYLAGMFIWTGFDYRGEPTPYAWPSITSYFGMVDLCGFPKDDTWYLKSWWTDTPTLHLLPHWNWEGKEGQPIEVWAYSNCDEVELFLNKKSLGKKAMQANSHLQWEVNYMPGTLEAIGYKNGKKILTDKVQTTKASATIHLLADKNKISVNPNDIAVITVDVKDKAGLHVPIADNEVTFTLKGPGRIIGVGNGNPTSLEKDRFIETLETVVVESLKEKILQSTEGIKEEVTVGYNDSAWDIAFKDERNEDFGKKAPTLVYRGSFTLPQWDKNATITFYSSAIGKEQTLYINGIAIAKNSVGSKEFIIDKSILHAGKNSIAIIATPLLKKRPWDSINTNPGVFQILTPAPAWNRKLFNGLAQVIVQPTGEAGEIILTAASPSLKTNDITIKVGQ